MLLLKLAFRPWRITPFSQLFSGMAVGFLLLLSGLLFWMQHGLRPVIQRLRQEQVITAYLAPTVEPGSEGRVIDEIRLALGSHAERSEIRLVPESEFIAHIKARYPELGKELEDLGPETGSIVPRYVTVSGLLIDQAADQIRAIPGVESADSSKDRYQHVLGAFKALRWVAELLVGGLALALLTGLIHLARNNAYIHRDAIALMRLLGGGGGALQAPGIVSGLLVGVFGGGVAAGGWLTAGEWLTRHVRHLSPILRDMPAATSGFALALFASGALLGLLAGLFGGASFFGGKDGIPGPGAQSLRG